MSAASCQVLTSKLANQLEQLEILMENHKSTTRKVLEKVVVDLSNAPLISFLKSKVSNMTHDVHKSFEDFYRVFDKATLGRYSYHDVTAISRTIAELTKDSRLTLDIALKNIDAFEPGNSAQMYSSTTDRVQVMDSDCWTLDSEEQYTQIVHEHSQPAYHNRPSDALNRNPSQPQVSPASTPGRPAAQQRQPASAGTGQQQGAANPFSGMGSPDTSTLLELRNRFPPSDPRTVPLLTNIRPNPIRAPFSSSGSRPKLASPQFPRNLLPNQMIAQLDRISVAGDASKSLDPLFLLFKDGSFEWLGAEQGSELLREDWALMVRNLNGMSALFDQASNRIVVCIKPLSETTFAIFTSDGLFYVKHNRTTQETVLQRKDLSNLKLPLYNAQNVHEFRKPFAQVPGQTGIYFLAHAEASFVKDFTLYHMDSEGTCKSVGTIHALSPKKSLRVLNLRMEGHVALDQNDAQQLVVVMKAKDSQDNSYFYKWVVPVSDLTSEGMQPSFTGSAIIKHNSPYVKLELVDFQIYDAGLIGLLLKSTGNEENNPKLWTIATVRTFSKPTPDGSTVEECAIAAHESPLPLFLLGVWGGSKSREFYLAYADRQQLHFGLVANVDTRLDDKIRPATGKSVALTNQNHRILAVSLLTKAKDTPLGSTLRLVSSPSEDITSITVADFELVA